MSDSNNIYGNTVITYEILDLSELFVNKLVSVMEGCSEHLGRAIVDLFWG